MNAERATTNGLLGCQARPWLQTMGPEVFRERLPDVMREISEIGFAGFETALTVLPLDEPTRFADWQRGAANLQLAGAHTGGAWWDPDKAASIPELMDEVGKLPGLGCDRLVVSIGAGVVELDDHDLAKMVTTLRTLGQGASQRGVQVAIHNHAHELADDARVIRALVGGTTAAELMLGTDIGWVAAAGWDVAQFIREFGDRLGYLHVRDVRAGRFVEVGEGELDWLAIVTALDDVQFHGWAVAESEFGERWGGLDDPLQTAEAQFRGMTDRGPGGTS